MKYLYTIWFFSLYLFTFAQDQQSFSLEEAITYGLSNSAVIKLEKLNVKDADGQILEYKSIGIPTISGGVDYQYFLDIPTQILPDFISPAVYGVLFQEGLLPQKAINTEGSAPVKFGKDQSLNASIALNTLLFDYTWIKGLKAQQLYRELVRKQVEQKEFDTRSNITKAYLAVLISNQNAVLLDNNIRNLEEIRRETNIIYENGFAEQLDVDRLDLSLSNLKTEREKIKNLSSITKNLLKFQMGYPIEMPIELKDNFDDLVNFAVAQKVALNDSINYNNRPEYQAINMGLRLQEINQQVIKLGKLPTLSGFASYSQQLQRNGLFNSDEAGWFPSTVVGVSLNVPIFDGFNRKAKLQRAHIETEKTLINKSEFERGMELTVRNARIQYINARETVKSRQNSLDLAEKIFDTSNIKYDAGVGSSLERSQAEADLYTAQNNYINALYDLIVAKTDLDIALGKI